MTGAAIIEARIAEADALAALLGRHGYSEGQALADARAEAMRDALALLRTGTAKPTADALAAPEARAAAYRLADDAHALDLGVDIFATDDPPPISADALAIGVEDGEAVALFEDGEEFAFSTAAPAEEEAAPAAPAAEPPPAERAADTGHDPRSHLTPTRAELLRKLWPDLRLTLRAIHARISALPGPAPAQETALYAYADKLGLPRRRYEAYAPPPAEPDTAEAEPAPEPPPPPAAAPAPLAPPPDPRAASLDRARELLRRGRAGAAVMQAAGITEQELRALNEEAAAKADAALARRMDNARDMLRQSEQIDTIVRATGLRQSEVIRLQAEMRRKAG